jgi:RNA polymerase sigma-70 factor (ECF subfamily)
MSRISGDSSANNHEIDASSSQLPQDDRVEKNMATLALDPVHSTGQKLQNAEHGHPAASHLVELDGDSAVMLRVRDGDDEAFNLLVSKYHRNMVHYMYRMTHNQAVAEELAQEVFLRVYRSRESYRAEARFSTWLYRIASNLGVNHARDTRHERTAHTIYLDEQDRETGTTPDVADSKPNVEQDLVRQERMEAIRKHVMALPERQRNAVLMHKYQGLDYRQIGEVLKLSESATKSLLFRAYQTLRERLKDFVQEN